MDIFSTTREAWNKTMPLHQKVLHDYYDCNFLKRDFTCLNKKDQKILVDTLCISKNKVAHLCCNNGVELMSLINLGANSCTGFDICDEAIKEAKVRCEKLNYPIQFYRTNIYDIDETFNNQFDIVYISVGSIRWLPDISKLYDTCYKLLRKGGALFISDVHPLAEIVNDDRDADISPLEITYQYITNDYYSDYGSLDYVGRTKDYVVKRVWYIHSFSKIIGLLPQKGFKIDFFNESMDDTAGVYELLGNLDLHIPLSFRLIALKQE
ncbi:bifunctional 3-demethylubiquinone-9 3-methyltransferase/ 2-octaprenyl-6-hydroxy phenol methylase [Clostridium sp. C105KSO15]|nr:bifunctional 3-demethylubiquinone-9 3-methyltransferase/ 2-octaprenyl-6-hydroxy phenol methylase [Clostridium sp. C105KSO15]